MLKIGILGTGHLGKIHIKCLKNIPDYQLVGFHDPDIEVCNVVKKQYGLRSYSSPEELINECDVIDIVSPTVTHYSLAKMAMNEGKHVFIEKPLCSNLEEAKELKSILNSNPGLKVQVGHVERYNPAWKAAKPFLDDPLFIEGHRLSMFNPRGTDVSVVEDLMIHDLDLILQVINSPVKEVRANGVSILSKSADICNARIEFENGAVANLTASRLSVKQMRKMRIFQSTAYISVNFLEKSSELIRLLSENESRENLDSVFELPVSGVSKTIQVKQLEKLDGNAIEDELRSLYSSIINDLPTEVSMDSGIAALSLADQIIQSINDVTST